MLHPHASSSLARIARRLALVVPLASVLVAIAACGDDEARASCGNGTLEANEECEGFDTRGASCDSLGFGVGRLRCNEQCKLDTTSCGVCGDRIVQMGEACDGTNLNGATCESLLGPGTEGTVSCSSDCRSLLTESCRSTKPPGALEACIPGTTTCPLPTSCVTTNTGAFCLEPCALGGDTCGGGRYCEDVGGAGACAEVPSAGQGCTARSGCKDLSLACIPTFTGPKGAVSTCAPPCAASNIGTGQATCLAGSSCVAVSGGPLELESPTSTCSVLTEATDCKVAEGYRCRSITGVAGPVNRCARGYGQCASVTPLYKFDGSPVVDALLCDRTQPTRGASKCGLVSPTPLTNPAQVACVEHFSGLVDIGVCIAFCDGTILSTGSVVVDGNCGLGAVCGVPAAPEHFLPQADARVACTAVDKTACTAQFDRCLDLGRGLECARAARICVPN